MSLIKIYNIGGVNMSDDFLNVFFYGFTLLVMLVAQVLVTSTSRKDILLGVKIPEEKVKTDQVRKIIKGYKRETILIGIIALILLGLPVYYLNGVRLILLCVFAYLGVLFLVYLRWNKKVKELKIQEGWQRSSKKVVVIDTDFSRDRGRENMVSMKWYLIPLLIIAVNIVAVLVMYKTLPETLPIHWDLKGNVDGYVSKSVFAALAMPITQLILFLVFYGSNTFMLSSKQQINQGNPEDSIKKNITNRRVWSIYFLVLLLLMEILITGLNLSILGLPLDVGLVNTLILIVSVASSVIGIVIGTRLGQGGDRIKASNDSLSKEYDIDDDDLWKLGNTIYYNPNDSSLFVEKRVGIGWTVNAARPLGMVLTIFPILLVVLLSVFMD